MSKSRALMLAVLLAGAAPTLAQDSGAPAANAHEAQATPAERLAALQEEFNTARGEFMKSYRAAKTDEERSELVSTLYPQPETYLPRAWAIVEDGGTADGVADTLLWITELDQSEGRARALERLAADFLESDATLGAVSGCGLYTADRASESFLRRVLEGTEREDMTGQALYSLAGVLRGLAESSGGVVAVEGASAPEPVDAELLMGEAEELLERVTKEYADLERYGRKLGDLAGGDLFEARNLSIGKVAPDIEGTDFDGVAFKLSDYRGKVVMLDFWGNW